MAAVLAVAAALVSYPPGASAGGGPFAADRELGPARLELTVDPARVGRNEIHLYLFDRRTGAQFERFDELTVRPGSASAGSGRSSCRASETGPGHYTVRGRRSGAGRRLGAGRGDADRRVRPLRSVGGGARPVIELVAHLLPLLLMLVALLAGRYPGADALTRPRRTRARPVRPARCLGRPLLAAPTLARGGRLVAASLAGRAPPPAA